MNLVTLQVPEYAVRYLARMCEHERNRIAYHLYREGEAYSLQAEADFDALNQIESVLP